MRSIGLVQRPNGWSVEILESKGDTVTKREVVEDGINYPAALHRLKVAFVRHFWTRDVV